MLLDAQTCWGLREKSTGQGEVFVAGYYRKSRKKSYNIIQLMLDRMVAVPW
jgi:hypothetical protein